METWVYIVCAILYFGIGFGVMADFLDSTGVTSDKPLTDGQGCGALFIILLWPVALISKIAYLIMKLFR